MPYIGRYEVYKTDQFSSVAQSCLTLCDTMNRSTPGLPVHHQLPQLTQIHAHWVGDAIQPSHPLSSPPPPAPNPSQPQGLFQWVNSLHEVSKVLKFQLQYKTNRPFKLGKNYIIDILSRLHKDYLGNVLGFRIWGVSKSPVSYSFPAPRRPHTRKSELEKTSF